MRCLYTKLTRWLREKVILTLEQYSCGLKSVNAPSISLLYCVAASTSSPLWIPRRAVTLGFALPKKKGSKKKTEQIPADPLNAFSAFPNSGLAVMHTIPARNICLMHALRVMLNSPLAAGTPVSIIPARNIGFLWFLIREAGRYRRKDAFYGF